MDSKTIQTYKSEREEYESCQVFLEQLEHFAEKVGLPLGNEDKVEQDGTTDNVVLSLLDEAIKKMDLAVKGYSNNIRNKHVKQFKEGELS